jgi:hypothetical protein
MYGKVLFTRPMAWVIGALVLGLVLAGPGYGQGLKPMPDAASQAEAKQLVEEVYAELLAAKTDEDRAAAARVLIMRASESDNVPAAKYVIYDTARSLAVEAGDTDVAMDAIRGLMSSFKDDSNGFLGVASVSLQTLARKARNDTQYAAVAQAGLEVVERMIAAERYDDALDLLTKLRNAALRSRRPELTSSYKELLDQLRIIRKEAGRIASDLKAIEQNPEDPALNLSVGKYITLYRGDWDKGLGLLAKSSDDVLAAAAKADLAGSEDTKGKMAIGDRWWKLAEEYSDLESQSLSKRAKYWYQSALPSASGIERGLLMKRLSPTERVIWGDLVLKPGIRTILEIDGDTAGAKPGPIIEETTWEFKEKPKGANKKIRLHFDAYLYFPYTAELGLKTNASLSEITVEINGRLASRGWGKSETQVRLYKGYNAVRGSIEVPADSLDNPKQPPKAKIVLTDLEGNSIPIPPEQWFYDTTR